MFPRSVPLLTLCVGAAAALATACSPPAINVPPKYGVSQFDKDASEIDIRMEQAGLADQSGSTALDSLSESMNDSVSGTSAGKPARFRMVVHHDVSPNIGMIILIALPIIDLITMPIIAATGAEIGKCIETGIVDVQVGGKFYHSEVSLGPDNEKSGYTFGADPLLTCMHRAMQVGLDSAAPVARPPRAQVPAAGEGSGQ